MNQYGHGSFFSSGRECWAELDASSLYETSLLLLYKKKKEQKVCIKRTFWFLISLISNINAMVQMTLAHGATYSGFATESCQFPVRTCTVAIS